MARHVRSDCTTDVVIQSVPKDRLRDVADLLRAVFGYTDLETPSPWLMYTGTLHGAVVIGAFDHGSLVGCAHAWPARDEAGWCMYLSALGVVDRYRSFGVAPRLMRLVADRARELGYDRMRWTAGSMNGPALYLYLAKLRAQLVGQHPQMHATLLGGEARPTQVVDELEFVWDLLSGDYGGWGETSGEAPPTVTRTREVLPGVRELRSWDPATVAAPRCLVEVPWDYARLTPELVTRWALGLRGVCSALFAHGHRGGDAKADREGKRLFLVFARRGD